MAEGKPALRRRYVLGAILFLLNCGDLRLIIGYISSLLYAVVFKYLLAIDTPSSRVLAVLLLQSGVVIQVCVSTAGMLYSFQLAFIVDEVEGSEAY